LAEKKISELTPLTGANLADNDEFAVVDTSAIETKAITFGELKTALDTSTGFVRITGDTMTGGLNINGGDLVVDTDTLFVDASTDRVGIGTSSPSQDLSVNGNVSATNFYVTSFGDTSANNISGAFVHGGSSSKSLAIQADPDNVGFNTAMRFEVDGSEVMRIAAGGNVGIGTSNPDQILHLAKTGIAGMRIEDLDAAGGYTDLEQNGSAFFIDAHDEDGTPGIVVFRTASSETMRITDSGNVGIGTSSPGSKLSVVGLPTSSSGLSAGDIWNDSGTLKIVT